MFLYRLQYWVYLILLIFSAIVFTVAFWQKPSKEQKILISIDSALTIILFGYWTAVQRPNLSIDTLILAVKMQYFGSILVVMTFYIALAFFFKIKMSTVITVLQAIVMFFLLAVILTFDKHSLFYKSFVVVSRNGYNVLVKKYGIMQRAFMIVVCEFFLLYLFMYKKIIKVVDRRLKINASLIILCAFFPFSFYLLEKILDLQFFKIVPIGAFLSCMVILFLISFTHFTDVKKLALSEIFDVIDDIIIIVDTNLFVKTSNANAKKTFPFLQNPNVGIQAITQQSVFHKIQEIFPSLTDKSKSCPKNYTIADQIFSPVQKEILNKSGQTVGYILTLKNITEEVKYNEKLESQVKEKTSQIREMQERTIIGFASLVEHRDEKVTGMHLRRTNAYSYVISEQLRKDGKFPNIIDIKWTDTIRRVAALHDVGKISIPDTVLNKPAPLTAIEFEEMQLHTIYGSEILATTLKGCVSDEYLKMAVEVARSHHENFDGSGYPDGLSGDEIPLSARVVHVADVFDALINERPYKKAFPTEKAIREIKNGKGRAFDPNVVEAFLKCYDLLLMLSTDYENGNML